MGAYVNPKGMVQEQDKLAFLVKYGRHVSRKEASEFTDFEGDELPVVCLDNGMFFALGIAFNDREVAEFTAVSDQRPKEYYMVNKSVLYDNSNLDHYLKRK